MYAFLTSRSPNRVREWSNLAFAAVIGLLVPLGLWWTVLIGHLVNENHDLRVLAEGDTPEMRAEHDRRRLMVWGESGTMAVLSASVVALSYAMAQRERQQLRRLEGILAASTHELKTPVAGIRALLESLQSGVLPPDRMGPHVGRGLQSCARLEHLVDGVLTWQRALASPENAAENAETRSLTNWLQPLLPADALHLADAGAVPVHTSPDALRVIVENLWENAKKYGGTQVRVSAALRGPKLDVAFQDDGIGFNPDDCERLFEPYQRLHTHTRGTGLGLYISRVLARAVGGDLHAASGGPGTGATFTLTLPISARSEA